MDRKTHRQRPCLLSSTSCSSSRNSSDWIVLSRDMITSPTSCPGRRLQLLVVVVRNRGHAPGAAFRATPHSTISLAATNEAARRAHLLAGHRVRPREVLLIADSAVRMSSKSCSEVSRQNVCDELESGRDEETNICIILDRSEGTISQILSGSPRCPD